MGYSSDQEKPAPLALHDGGRCQPNKHTIKDLMEGSMSAPRAVQGAAGTGTGGLSWSGSRESCPGKRAEKLTLESE